MNHTIPETPEASGDTPDSAGVHATSTQRLLLRPPRIALMLLLAAAALDGWMDWPRLFDGPWRALGALAVLLGLTLTTWTLRLFDAASTTHHPYGEPAAFIRTGPYRFSRNPMYLGVTLFVLGVGVLVGTPAMSSVWALFAFIIHVRFIPREERALERRFGAEYDAYRARVRTWL